ncbi:DUF397 domain-containing protein [Streptomyces sp. URMC 127]|uniref:DUF397 domain-containing protein n=1 Tax=Streptomyces sp. URMC 127 TaxID=3423402 RepID=UPI003F1945A4
MSTGLQWHKSSYSDDSGGDCVEVATEWRKSSHSAGDGGDCVEVADDWRKSSHSDDSGGHCIEVARRPDRAPVHIRDSKNPTGPALTVEPPAWSAFLGYATGRPPTP